MYTFASFEICTYFNDKMGRDVARLISFANYRIHSIRRQDHFSLDATFDADDGQLSKKASD